MRSLCIFSNNIYIYIYISWEMRIYYAFYWGKQTMLMVNFKITSKYKLHCTVYPQRSYTGVKTSLDEGSIA